jgi:hypothetical protein
MSVLKSLTENSVIVEHVYDRAFRVLGSPWAPEKTTTDYTVRHGCRKDSTQEYTVRHRRRKRQHKITQSAISIGEDNVCELWREWTDYSDHQRCWKKQCMREGRCSILSPPKALERTTHAKTTHAKTTGVILRSTIGVGQVYVRKRRRRGRA